MHNTATQLRHYRANIDQYGTIIRVGIFDAKDPPAAEAIFAKLLWPGATLVSIDEVPAAEVARIRNRLSVPNQLALPGI